jgi:hypothetical protein
MMNRTFGRAGPAQAKFASKVKQTTTAWERMAVFLRKADIEFMVGAQGV